MKKKLLKNFKIYVAGHNGMVGTSIYKCLKESGYDNLVTVSRQQLDLVETDKVNNWFKDNITIKYSARGLVE